MADIQDKTCYIFYNNYWWELVRIRNGRKSTFRCLNVWGSGFDLEEKQLASICRKYRLAIVTDRTELDWKGTCVYDDKYETGWVDRQGNFYGCDYEAHSAQAELIHKTSERVLEMKGWIKLTYGFGHKNEPIILYDPDTKPTKQQIDYIAGTNFRKDTTFDYLMHYIY